MRSRLIHEPRARPAHWIAAAALAAWLTASCSPLKTFDGLVPKDPGVAKPGRGLAFGEGPRRTLDVYVPKAVSARAGGRPIMVFFYGGSWNSGTRRGYAFVGRALAAQGFVTVIPDYRLVPEVRYPGFVEDGAAAVRWARSNAGRFGGDPDAIVLAGHSAGAYIAAMLALDARWLGSERSAVKGLIGLAGPYDFAPFDVAASRAAFGAWPRPEETQPVHWAGAGDPPALLLVGDKDNLVRPANSEALAARLRASGVPATLRRFGGLGHIGLLTAIARPLRSRGAVLPEMAAFVRDVTASAETGPAKSGPASRARGRPIAIGPNGPGQ